LADAGEAMEGRIDGFEHVFEGETELS
jgi:hypothetical protein